MILSYQTILQRMDKQHEPAHERISITTPDAAEDASRLVQAAGFELRMSRDGTCFFPGTAEGSLGTRVMHRVLSMETITIPHDCIGWLTTVSSLARHGLQVSLNSPNLKPGWSGRVLFELYNTGEDTLNVPPGAAIAHVTLMKLDKPTELPYAGKYQNQDARALDQPARYRPDILKLK